MIPDQISQAVRRMQGGQGTEQDVQYVESWFSQNQGTLDNATSATISSAISKSKMMASSSQIGIGNQNQQTPFPTYVTPGTPASLPSSRNHLRPDWAGMGGITSGLPATDLNLEASMAGTGDPGQIPSHDMGMPFDYGSRTTEGGLHPQGYSDQERSAAMANATYGSGGSGVAADPGLGYGSDFSNPDVLSYFTDLTSGTPLEGMSPAGIQMMVDDPRIFAKMLAEESGGGPNTEAFLGPRADAAVQMARLGILGRGTRGAPGSGLPGQNLTSSPSSSADEMVVAQQFMDQFNQPGSQFVDVNKLYQEAFRRSQNTNFEGLTDQQGNPLGIDGSIQLVNKALQQSAPFMSEEEKAWLSSTLEAAALQYKTALAKGDITMSYPNYLQSLGIDQMLAGS